MAGGIWAALAGYCFAYYNSQVQEQRKAQIERVNMQLRDLYGPLLACVTATKSSYEAMIRQHSPDGSRASFQRAVAERPDGPEARAYRMWVSSVLQPLNEKAADIVHGGFSLMEPSSSLEADLLQLVAHVSASRVLLERWAQGELQTTSAISYPDTLEESVRREFSRIKARQRDLLGVSPPKLIRRGQSSWWWGGGGADHDKAGAASTTSSNNSTRNHTASSGSSQPVSTQVLQGSAKVGIGKQLTAAALLQGCRDDNEGRHARLGREDSDGQHVQQAAQGSGSGAWGCDHRHGAVAAATVCDLGGKVHSSQHRTPLNSVGASGGMGTGHKQVCCAGRLPGQGGQCSSSIRSRL